MVLNLQTSAYNLFQRMAFEYKISNQNMFLLMLYHFETRLKSEGIIIRDTPENFEAFKKWPIR
jgi:hypothetical protein